MALDLVALRVRALADLTEAVEPGPQHEERSRNVPAPEKIEKSRSVTRIWTIVEGERDLLAHPA